MYACSVCYIRRCSATDFNQFVEYDSRAHRLNALASFSYFVSSMSAQLNHMRRNPLTVIASTINHTQQPRFSHTPLLPGLAAKDSNCLSSVSRFALDE